LHIIVLLVDLIGEVLCVCVVDAFDADGAFLRFFGNNRLFDADVSHREIHRVEVDTVC